MGDTPHVLDVTEQTFTEEVLRRSNDLPVVVDFWAEWCGPCRTLGPILEAAVAERDGAVVLAKVDTDANPALSQSFGIRGIPAVKAFWGGRVVDEFTGALPRSQVDAFLDRIQPSPADLLAQQAAVVIGHDPRRGRELYEQALAHDPRHEDASLGLALALEREDPARARALAAPHRPRPLAEEVLARLDVAEHAGGDVDELRRAVDRAPGDGEARLALGRSLAAAGEHEEAFTHLLEAVKAGGDVREAAREQVVQLFTALGAEHELTQRVRPRLAAALY